VAERHADLGRWVRLSAGYHADRRIRRVHPLAELVWVRGLAVARQQGSDGHIDAEWSPVELGRGLTSDELNDATDALVRVGLWEPCDDGWRVPRARWARWQDTEDDYDAVRKRERERKAAWRAAKRAAGQADADPAT